MSAVIEPAPPLTVRLATNRRVLAGVVASWLLLAVFSLAQEHVRTFYRKGTMPLLEALPMYGGGTVAWIAVTIFLFAVIDFVELRSRGRGLLPLAMVVLLTTIAVVAVEIWLQIHVAPRWLTMPGTDPWAMGFAFRFHDALFQAWQIVAVGMILHRRDRLLREASSVVELKKDLADEQMRVLRSKVEPHLLYNTLNSTAELVVTAPERAERILVALVELLRMMTYGDGESLAPVSEEVRHAALFLQIQQLRFGDRLRVEWDIEPATLAEKVPTFTLQPLVENSIKHAVREETIHIRVEAQCVNSTLVLRVRDNGQKAFAAALPPRRSLANLQERLRIFTPHAELSLLRNDEITTAEVRVPLNRTRPHAPAGDRGMAL